MVKKPGNGFPIPKTKIIKNITYSFGILATVLFRSSANAHSLFEKSKEVVKGTMSDSWIEIAPNVFSLKHDAIFNKRILIDRKRELFFKSQLTQNLLFGSKEKKFYLAQVVQIASSVQNAKKLVEVKQAKLYENFIKPVYLNKELIATPIFQKTGLLQKKMAENFNSSTSTVLFHPYIRFLIGGVIGFMVFKSFTLYLIERKVFLININGGETIKGLSQEFKMKLIRLRDRLKIKGQQGKTFIYKWRLAILIISISLTAVVLRKPILSYISNVIATVSTVTIHKTNQKFEEVSENVVTQKRENAVDTTIIVDSDIKPKVDKSKVKKPKFDKSKIKTDEKKKLIEDKKARLEVLRQKEIKIAEKKSDIVKKRNDILRSDKKTAAKYKEYQDKKKVKIQEEALEKQRATDEKAFKKKILKKQNQNLNKEIPPVAKSELLPHEAGVNNLKIPKALENKIQDDIF